MHDFNCVQDLNACQQINYTVPQHSGRYRCLATNSEGKTLTREAFVEIKLPASTSDRLRSTFTGYHTQHTGKTKQKREFIFVFVEIES